MNLQELLRGVRMMPEAAEGIRQITVSEEEYGRMKRLFRSDRQAFYEEILVRDRFRIYFLYYFCRMACDTYEYYCERKIEERIFWDTFYDLTLWCEDCYRKSGEYGIQEYDWFFRHLECDLFRLGRLEFEKMSSVWEVKGHALDIRKGVPVISIHIPAGERLDIPSAEESFRQAFKFLGKERLYLCHSWLLYPGLAKILPEDSNILQFQRLFQVVQTDYEEREAEQRIYGYVCDDPKEYPQKTRLQQRAAQYIAAGGRLGSGLGVLR